MSSIESRENFDLINPDLLISQEEESLPLGIIIVIAGKPGVGKTLAAENFTSQNDLPEPLTIGRLIRKKTGIHEKAVNFDPSKRSPKVDRKYDDIAIETILNHPRNEPSLVIESDLGVWHAEKAIEKGLDPKRVVTVQLDASEMATGIRVLKRKRNINPDIAIDPEKAIEKEIQEAYAEVESRNQKDRDNWQNVYEGEVGDPYDESRFDVLINTDKHNENGKVFDVSKSIKKAVFAVLAWRAENRS